MMTGDGRQVFICTRTKSQTVNICDANNRRGDYDWIVRLFQPQVVTEREITQHADTPQVLVQWLQAEKGGQLEREPPQEVPLGPPAPPDGLPPAPDEDPWIKIAVSIVEQSIDQLVREFLRIPYLHRKEHSLHTRLFGILAAQPHFARELPMQNGRFHTQPLHKEWPETIPQENTRRGSFDLAVLTPWQFADCDVDKFREGKLPAPIVIEIGLDYGPAHLAGDRDKLVHSQVRFGYLVHLTRNRPEEQAEEIILDPAGDGHVKTAYACACGNVRRYKFVNGEHNLEPQTP